MGGVWVWYWGGVLIGGWSVGVVLGKGTDWWVECGCGIGEGY